MNSILIVLCLSFLIMAKPKVAVFNVKATGGISQPEIQLISDRLEYELFNTKTVDILERNEISFILEEQGFQNSGSCTDKSCLVEVGQLLGVEYIITGSIGQLNSVFLVNLKSIDVATARIDKVISLDIRDGREGIVRKLEYMARELTFDPDNLKPAIIPEPVKYSDTVWEAPKEIVYYGDSPRGANAFESESLPDYRYIPPPPVLINGSENIKPKNKVPVFLMSYLGFAAVVTIIITVMGSHDKL